MRFTCHERRKLVYSQPRQTSLDQDDFPDLSRDSCPDDPDRTPLEFDDDPWEADPWEAFLPDDQPEPLPEPGDFWIESDQTDALSLVA
jgi:hypothetical protein